MNKAIYPGSFDPFTNGHLDIVIKSAKLFDHVHIVLGVNTEKKRSYDAGKMKLAIEKTLAEHSIANCDVCVHDGLIAQYTADNKIGYMIRGLRNNLDYNYEENIAEINKLIDPKLEYIYFRAENVAVSSSMVKELYLYHQDIAKFVPQPMLDVMTK